MADKKGATIVIKKKKGGHAGAHGGAWKVAYADFMTAMMCFFMVMWLMGSDEPSESNVTHYFNSANSPYKAGKDPKSNAIHPMGERDGHGDSVLNGLNGGMPDDTSMAIMRQGGGQGRPSPQEVAEEVREKLDGKAFGFDVNMDYLKFSVPENLLFTAGQTGLKPEAKAVLQRIGKIVKSHGGYLRVYGHSDQDPRKGGRFPVSYEASLARAVAVMSHLVEKNYIGEEFVSARGVSSVQDDTAERSPASRAHDRRIDFVLSVDPLRKE